MKHFACDSILLQCFVGLDGFDDGGDGLGIDPVSDVDDGVVHFVVVFGEGFGELEFRFLLAVEPFGLF